MNSNNNFLLLYTSLFLLFSSSSANDSGCKLPFIKSMQQITPSSLWQHYQVLGHDSLEGRGTGTRGEKIAAKYIAGKCREIGLLPFGDNGTFYQNIPMHSSRPLQSSEFTLFAKDTVIKFEIGKDYLLFKSGAQTFIPNPIPLVFVGYGIIAPEYDYNDYQSVDVEGKVVIYLSGEPASEDSAYFEGKASTVYSYPESKERMAISRGARGSIMLLNPREESDKTWNFWQKEFSFPDVTLAYSVTSHFSIILNPASAIEFFKGSKYSLYDIYSFDRKQSMKSFSLSGFVNFRGQFEQKDFFSQNIVGLLKGSHPKLNDSYIIVTAHYDHLGIGTTIAGDSIYNGVIDNASGVAGLIEIARSMSTVPFNPKRSIIFLFVTGEEKGTLGSTYYIDNPIKPLYKSIANINVDGLAMFDTFYDIVGIGSELSTLGTHLNKAALNCGLKSTSIPSQFLRTESFGRSDQIVFAKAGIPSLLVMEGLTYQNLTPNQSLKKFLFWQKNIYHTPFDDLDQEINMDAACQHCRFLFSFIWDLANNDKEPEWHSRVKYKNARLQSRAEKR